MKSHALYLNACLTLMACSPVAISSPASTDYVNSRIQEAVSTLEIQIKQETKTIETQINDRLLHEIGEAYQGGIIFWLDETKTHGLVVSKMDSHDGQGMAWQNGDSGDKTTNARANGVYAGLSNTQLIISEQTIDDQDGQFAALVAKNFSVQSDGLTPCDDTHSCYGNWYLPSLNELQLLRANLYLQGHESFPGSGYWSSTELSVNQALALDFTQGSVLQRDKANTELHIRPIHAF